MPPPIRGGPGHNKRCWQSGNAVRQLSRLLAKRNKDYVISSGSHLYEILKCRIFSGSVTNTINKRVADESQLTAVATRQTSLQVNRVSQPPSAELCLKPRNFRGFVSPQENTSYENPRKYYCCVKGVVYRERTSQLLSDSTYRYCKYVICKTNMLSLILL